MFIHTHYSHLSEIICGAEEPPLKHPDKGKRLVVFSYPLNATRYVVCCFGNYGHNHQKQLNPSFPLKNKAFTGILQLIYLIIDILTWCKKVWTRLSLFGCIVATVWLLRKPSIGHKWPSFARRAVGFCLITRMESFPFLPVAELLSSPVALLNLHRKLSSLHL